MKLILTIIGVATLYFFVYAMCKAASDADRIYGITEEAYAKANTDRNA